MPEGPYATGSSSVSAAESEAMHKSAQEFEAAVNACEKVQQGINDILQQMGMTWKGQASNDFAIVMASWGEQFRKVIYALDFMKDTLNVSAVHYDANEYEQANLSTQLHTALDGV